MCANEQVSEAQSEAGISQSSPGEQAQTEQDEITRSGDSKDTDLVAEQGPDQVADTADTQTETHGQEPTETVTDTQETEPAQAEADDTDTQVAQTSEADEESEALTTVLVEDSLTFDENHFSTPTAASPAASAAHSDTEVSPGRAGRDTLLAAPDILPCTCEAAVSGNQQTLSQRSRVYSCASQPALSLLRSALGNCL